MTRSAPVAASGRGRTTAEPSGGGKRASGQRRAAAKVVKRPAAPTPVRWAVGSADDLITVRIDGLRLVSEANQRGNWRVSQGRKQTQRAVVGAALRGVSPLTRCKLPLRITLTRVGPRKLDDDNLAGAGKKCRDTIAKHIGIDDGDDARLAFEYRQEPGPYGLVITFETANRSDVYGARRARDTAMNEGGE